jgi:hypothetical protein
MDGEDTVEVLAKIVDRRSTRSPPTSRAGTCR